MSSRYRPLPLEMAEKWGHLNHLQYKPGSNEWSSACPACGESGHNSLSGTPDRFTMFPEDKRSSARGWCRQCGHFEWVGSDAEPPSAARIKEMEEIKEEQEAAERQRLENRLNHFMAEKLWQFYHDEMTDKERWLWENQGIPRQFQDLWTLGYMGHYPSKRFDSEALTIPHFGVGRTPSNLQYRLLQPPKPNDKYRFTMGLPHALWLPEPDRDLTGTCILCEGMKKAAVTWIRFVVEPDNQQYTVVSVPSKSPAKALYPLLNQFDRIYVAMDPDAYRWKKDGDGNKVKPSIYNMVEQINGPAVNVVTLPTKADDFFTMYGGTAKSFMGFIRQAREVKQRTDANKKESKATKRGGETVLRPFPRAASTKLYIPS